MFSNSDTLEYHAPAGPWENVCYSDLSIIQSSHKKQMSLVSFYTPWKQTVKGNEGMKWLSVGSLLYRNTWSINLSVFGFSAFIFMYSTISIVFWMALSIQLIHISGWIFLLGGRGEPPTKFSKRGGLTEPQFLEGRYWERGGDFFQGGLQFLDKK